jgi:hypothetical protein
MIKNPSEKQQELQYDLKKEGRPFKVMFLKISFDKIKKIWRKLCGR